MASAQTPSAWVPGHDMQREEIVRVVEERQGEFGEGSLVVGQDNDAGRQRARGDRGVVAVFERRFGGDWDGVRQRHIVLSPGALGQRLQGIVGAGAGEVGKPGGDFRLDRESHAVGQANDGVECEAHPAADEVR